MHLTVLKTVTRLLSHNDVLMGQTIKSSVSILLALFFFYFCDSSAMII